MKTYLLLANGKFLATEAKSGIEALKKCREAGYNARKNLIIISSVHIDYCTSAIKII